MLSCLLTAWLRADGGKGYDLTLNELAVAGADLGRFATRGTLTFDGRLAH